MAYRDLLLPFLTYPQPTVLASGYLAGGTSGVDLLSDGGWYVF